MKPKRINKKQLRPIVEKLTDFLDWWTDSYPPEDTVKELSEIAGDLSYLLDGE